jgi:hypothetical protein
MYPEPLSLSHWAGCGGSGTSPKRSISVCIMTSRTDSPLIPAVVAAKAMHRSALSFLCAHRYLERSLDSASPAIPGVRAKMRLCWWLAREAGKRFAVADESH